MWYRNFSLLLVTMTIATMNFALANEDLLINSERAKVNYQLRCQGCHTPNAMGNRSVPQMKNVLGVFMNSAEGREYLIRVPGVANAFLTDAELSELMNWVLLEFAGNSLPESWQAFNEDEISQLRARPFFDPLSARATVLRNLQTITNSQ